MADTTMDVGNEITEIEIDNNTENTENNKNNKVGDYMV